MDVNEYYGFYNRLGGDSIQRHKTEGLAILISIRVVSIKIIDREKLIILVLRSQDL